MAAHNERREAIAIIKMFKYLEGEIRGSLGDEHLAELSRTIANELSRRYQASNEEVKSFDRQQARRPQLHAAVVE